MVFRTIEENLKLIGDSLRARRLALDLTQSQVAERSGVSLKAVKRLEGGVGSSLNSLIAVTRTLQKSAWLQVFEPEVDFSPIAMADALNEGRAIERRRASGKGA